MAGSHKSTFHQQPGLALSREQRFFVLARIDPARAGNLGERQWANVRLLCEQVELATGRDGCNAHVATLAAKCRWSRRTLLRVAELGRHAGVLDWSPQYDDRGRSSNRWWVNWDRLSSWAGPVDPGECQQRVSGVALTGTHRSDLALTDDSSKDLPKVDPNTNKTSSSLPVGGATSVGTHRGDWRRLEDFLISLGVDRAPDACRIAREQGLAVDDVRAIAAHWQAHGGGQPHAAWGVAALCWRVQHARPNLPADRGWPKPALAWEKHLAGQRLVQQTLERRRELATAERTERAGGTLLQDYLRQCREANRDG